MKTSALFVAVLACLQHEGFSQETFFECPQIDVMEGFEKERFVTGGWYEIGHYRQIFEDEISCLYSEYKHIDQENSWFSNSYTTPRSVKRESVFVNENGILDCAVDELTPKYDTSGIVQLTRSYMDPSVFEGMRVIATDYDNYAVLHECDSDGFERMQVLSRTPSMKEEYVEFIQRVMEYKESDFSMFVRTDNFGSCPYRNVKKNNAEQSETNPEQLHERKQVLWW